MTTPLRVTEVLPLTLEGVDVATAEGRAWLEGRYAPPAGSFVRVNMITSLTGSAVGADGTSDTLTNRVDRTILGVIRGHSDVVLVGAQSVRAEQYVVPRSARLAIVTATGDLDGHRLETTDRSQPVILLCPTDREEAVRSSTRGLDAQILPIQAPGGRLTPPAIIGALGEIGLTRIVCEGGPTLASQFVAAEAIDELCITSAPALEPSAAPFIRIESGGSPRTEVSGMLVDEAGFSYLRLRVRRQDPASPATR